MASNTELPRALGIDVGTSGVRIAAIDASGRTLALASRRYENPGDASVPSAWWRSVEDCFATLAEQISLQEIAAIAVDGTSGTVLALDAGHVPVGKALMYNAPCPDPAISDLLAAIGPADSPAIGMHSPLARATFLAGQDRSTFIVHQADWIAMQLGVGRPVSDENNALKTGYDLANRAWPDWISALGLDVSVLPEVVPAGTPLGPVGARARAFGVPASAIIVSGTTDGCASFLATGASGVGEAVTALGSTLVLKLLSNREIKAPEYGVYSHRIAGTWLAGGASNTGGAVIRAFFSDEKVTEVSGRVDPNHPTGLDYYPLLRPGERFPVSDPAFPPRLEPQPDDEAVFLQGILEGIAAVEAEGYARLSELGAPRLKSMRTVGGGAVNRAWTRIRQRLLDVPFVDAVSTEAASGTARLALSALSS